MRHSLSTITPLLFVAVLFGTIATAQYGYVFSTSSSFSEYCTDCCEENGCSFSSQAGVERDETPKKDFGISSSASCSGAACDCYSNGRSSSIADITAMAK